VYMVWVVSGEGDENLAEDVEIDLVDGWLL
jgi:hypothetical protein